MGSREIVMDCEYFRNLYFDDPDDILRDLDKNVMGLKNFLGKKRFDERDIDASIRAISKGCEGKDLARVQRLLKLICTERKFISDDVLHAIERIHFGDHNINLPKLLESYANLLEHMVERLTLYETVQEILPRIKSLLELMKNMKINFNSAKMVLKRVEGLCVQHDNAMARAEDEEKTTPFRDISIFPQSEDINDGMQALRPNVIDGSYLNVDDYLDVQFKLMREDMVATFRDSIISNKKSGSHSTLVVHNLTVSYPPRYTVDGVCYNISFEMKKAVTWDSSKILLPGSLLCLSSDNFRLSFIFATIKERIPRTGSQRNCKIEVTVEEKSCDIDPKIKYSFIETSAYFESYRHVLKAFKRFNENNLPFSDYIVYLNFRNCLPKHLTDKVFCLHEKCDPTIDEEAHKCKNFAALDLEEWPSAEDLKLDEFQHDAFKKALTQKFVLIQGPPGTGKTFLGVKIVKTILENLDEKPIIICCYTNHALDQFLDRILRHTKRVVRMGGQSELISMKPHILGNMRRAVRAKRGGDYINPSDHIMLRALEIAELMVPNICVPAPSPMPDKLYLDLVSVTKKLNYLLRTFCLVINNYMDDSALNEILSPTFKATLCRGDSRENKLSDNIMKWLDVKSVSEVYDKCGKGVPDNLDITVESSEVKLDSFANIWGYNKQKRYAFFKAWRCDCISNLTFKIEETKKEYFERLGKCSKPLDFDCDLLLHNADIIGLTMTGASKFFDQLNAIKPTIMIIEEAAEALEAHLVTSLVPSIKQLILIGDHEQLRPIPATHLLEKKFNFNISLFERLFKNNAPSSTLVTQHRMRPCIAELLVPDIYSQLNSHQSVHEYEDVKGTSKNLFFLNHEHPENLSSGVSISNDFEVDMILKVALYFLKQGYKSSQITVLAMYAEQVRLLTQNVKSWEVDLHVTTVDNYQGEENDIILISFVRSNADKCIGFLKESNRVCVALSRARKGLFCVGNFTMLAEKSPLFSSIVDKLNMQDMIGSGLPLQCVCHQRVIHVGEIKEFDTFFDRGCGGECGVQLQCGHSCRKLCHCDDLEHKLYKCQEPCEKQIIDAKTGNVGTCTRMCGQSCKSKKKKVNLLCGHKVKVNCTEADEFDVSTFECNVDCDKYVARCGHFIKVPCYEFEENTVCSALLPITQPCGHVKTISCSQINNVQALICIQLTPVIAHCGHTVEIPCYLSTDNEQLLTFCRKSCDKLLRCGHPCVGLCNWCYNVKIHPSCLLECERKLQCGHVCQGACGSPCLPCSVKCSLKCRHISCSNPCSTPCIKCMKPCERSCEHQRCNRLCFEICEVPPCKEPCSKTLTCGHKCIGLCGDTCPFLCRICHPEEFNSKTPADAYYVLLEDCDHIIEVAELTLHIVEAIDSCEWPYCPKCRKMITMNQRFSDNLKKAKEAWTALDLEEDIEEINYLFHSLFGLDGVAPWRFQEIQKTIKSLLELTTPCEASLTILKAFLQNLPELITLNDKVEACPSIEDKLQILIKWICNHLTCASYQQITELEEAISELAYLTSQSC